MTTYSCIFADAVVRLTRLPRDVKDSMVSHQQASTRSLINTKCDVQHDSTRTLPTDLTENRLPMTNDKDIIAEYITDIPGPPALKIVESEPMIDLTESHPSNDVLQSNSLGPKSVQQARKKSKRGRPKSRLFTRQSEPKCDSPEKSESATAVTPELDQIHSDASLNMMANHDAPKSDPLIELSAAYLPKLAAAAAADKEKSLLSASDSSTDKSKSGKSSSRKTKHGVYKSDHPNLFETFMPKVVAASVSTVCLPASDTTITQSLRGRTKTITSRYSPPELNVSHERSEFCSDQSNPPAEMSGSGPPTELYEQCLPQSDPPTELSGSRVSVSDALTANKSIHGQPKSRPPTFRKHKHSSPKSDSENVVCEPGLSESDQQTELCNHSPHNPNVEISVQCLAESVPHTDLSGLYLPMSDKSTCKESKHGRPKKKKNKPKDDKTKSPIELLDTYLAKSDQCTELSEECLPESHPPTELSETCPESNQPTELSQPCLAASDPQVSTKSKSGGRPKKNKRKPKDDKTKSPIELSDPHLPKSDQSTELSEECLQESHPPTELSEECLPESHLPTELSEECLPESHPPTELSETCPESNQPTELTPPCLGASDPQVSTKSKSGRPKSASSFKKDELAPPESIPIMELSEASLPLSDQPTELSKPDSSVDAPEFVLTNHQEKINLSASVPSMCVDPELIMRPQDMKLKGESGMSQYM